MALLIKKVGSEYCPVIVCDECGSEIRIADDGIYLFGGLHDGQYQQPWFVHKRCQRRSQRALLWSPLQDLPGFLRGQLGARHRTGSRMTSIIITCKRCLRDYEPNRDDIMRGLRHWSLCNDCRAQDAAELPQNLTKPDSLDEMADVEISNTPRVSDPEAA